MVGNLRRVCIYTLQHNVYITSKCVFAYA